jgi:hypothetical protein
MSRLLGSTIILPDEYPISQPDHNSSSIIAEAEVM